MERPTMLIEAILNQFSIDLGLSVERDVASLRHRYEHEGFSFLAITLPKLSDALLQGIESGRLSCPTDFSRHGRLPRFLGGFFSRVFSRDGTLLENVEADAILAIRQICDFWKKPKIACDPRREDAAEANYIQVEEELSMLTPAINREDFTLDQVAAILWKQAFPELDPLDIKCKHGPGNTADRILLNRRHRFKWWYARCEPWFPSDLHAYPNYGYASDHTGTTPGESGLDFLDVEREPPVRVVFVPKTLKAPRVIALEPAPMQFMQQGLLQYLVPRLQSFYLTKSSIRFTDQTINQRLAYKASIDRKDATLDLKDASDRVHVDLVKRILRGTGIYDYVIAARSLRANLPSGRTLDLHKFASMGSAICFPIEAMVFYTLIQSAVHKHDGRRPTSRSISKYSRRIAVYGDDIIIPVEYTDSVVGELEAYGLRVNTSKSFRTSLFRESCGADFYNGKSVRPIYAREVTPSDPRNWTAKHVLSWAATSDQFYSAGLWKPAQAIRDMLERVLHLRIPRSREKRGSGVYFYSALFDTDCRYNRKLCAFEQKRIVYNPVKRKDYIDEDAIACLNRWGLSTPAPGTGQRDHYSRRLERNSCSDHSRLEDPGTGRPVEHSARRIEFGDQPQRPSFGVLGLQGEVPALWHSTNVVPGILGEGQLGTDGENYESGSDREIWFLGRRLSTEGLDFRFSVKRGDFKPTRRWITMFS